jgi:4-hydroxy-tetrahydrodipicolinate synthase
MRRDSAAAESLKSALATVVAVAVTPFDADGVVDWDTHVSLLRRLVD